MSRNYDNWERLVAAVIKRRQIWELCHQQSSTTSTYSETSSDISSCFRLSDLELENKGESARIPDPEPVSLKGHPPSRSSSICSDDESSDSSSRSHSYFSDSEAPSDRFSSCFWSSDFELVKADLKAHHPSRTSSICSEATSDFRFSSCFQRQHTTGNKGESGGKRVPKLLSLKGVWRIQLLGKGRFGKSILTHLYGGISHKFESRMFLSGRTLLVMKKLSGEVKMTEQVFETVFGSCRHENVAVPRAYYFSIDENFILNDYHSKGSVYDMLHRTVFPRPGWVSRLKVAVGAARGIAHIHRQCGGKLAHGNIRSSNIFLNSKYYGCVSDFGLADIITTPGHQQGCLDYHASEFEFKKASHESDVYSFGVLLLELLTGRSPMEPQGSQKNLHITAWACSIRPEDWSSKMFDQSIHGLLCDELDMVNFVKKKKFEINCYSAKNITVLGATISHHLESTEVQMVEMLRVAMRCVAMLPWHRPKMFEVVLMLDNIYSKFRQQIISERL